uniref:Myb-like domain-containing protein n=1 Tax=Magallana gigas TaxID=29159 RepID=A0A8W8IGB9_MAGGI
MERFYPAHRSTEPQCFLSGSRSADPSSFDPASRSFCSSTPLYRHYDQKDRALSVIPQCLAQRYQKHSLQSQSCRPMLIHNSFSDNSFEYQSSLRNSVGVHQGWRSMVHQPSDVPTKSCSVDLCQDGYCHNPHTGPSVTRRGSFPPLVTAPASGMMHVIEENNGDRVISTSDEVEEGESYGNTSDVYPLTQNTGSLAGQFGSEQAEVQSLYSWIIKLLPDKSGPCVEGKLREEDDTFWHSSLIAERLNSHLVQTVSGKKYHLMGDMEVEEAVFGGFDEQTVREFVHGFPTHWRDVVDQFFLRIAAKSPDPELSDNDVDNDDISLLEETLTPSEDKHTPEAASVMELKEKVGRPKKVIAKKPVTRARKSGDGKKTPPAKIPPHKNVKKKKIVNEDVVNGDVNLVEETPNPSEDKPITEVKESKKKVGRPKKVIAKLPLTQIKKVDKGKKVSPPTGKSPPKARPSPNSVKVSKRKSATTLLNETEMYTPNGKMIQLDTVQTTRSGRAVKPVVAWYTGQSVSIDPDTNSYVVKYRTQSAESFHKDMAQFFKTRSHVSRKTLNKKEAVKGRKKEKGKENEVTHQSEVTWTKDEVTRFNLIVRKLNQDDPDFWNKIMNYVRTKTIEECQEHFYTAMSSRKRPSKPQNSAKDPKEHEVALTAKRGTLKRKQQLRDLVDHSNKRYQEDLFDGTPYRHHSKIPRLSGDQQDDVFAELSKRNPHMMNKVFTPMTRINMDPVSTKKTPSSGLSADPKINRKDADQYIHKMNIQRRKLGNKKTKQSKDKVKDKTPVPNKKLFGKSDDLQSLLMERCDSDSNHDDSDQESDYYFSEEGDVVGGREWLGDVVRCRFYTRKLFKFMKGKGKFFKEFFITWIPTILWSTLHFIRVYGQ